MLAPLSWLKEYVDITIEPHKLGGKLTEIGLGTEKITKLADDIIFEFEITPNRPDLLSIIGIAREIAAIEDKKLKFQFSSPPPSPGALPIHPNGVIKGLKPKKNLPLKIITDSKINPRFTGIIIDEIKVEKSPGWLSDRLIKIGQRPINNIVDITNYVMFELGNPVHAFDYKKIKGTLMRVHQAKGGEEFISVDGISYHLPKGAVVISDEKDIIDLCGIKGGLNSGTFDNTKTIFIRVPVENPVLIRRASKSLGIRSEASSIFERGVNTGGTIEALKRCVNLVLEIAGGEIASPLYDIKKENFLAWTIDLSLQRLNKILGIEIPKTKVIDILNSLNLQTKNLSEDKLRATVPTYRNDLKIEEDIIEEVARIYGYNKFPKTLPVGQIPTKQVPYFKDYRIEEKVKNIFKAAGFSEIYTYSLVSEKDLTDNKINPEKTLRVDNPVSREFEYLRSSLLPNLKKALMQNEPFFEKINLFELGKVYLGSSIDNTLESYCLSGITNDKNFYEVKGIVEELFDEFGIAEDTANNIHVIDEGIFFEINFSKLITKINLNKSYKPIPKYPPITEDITITVNEKDKIGQIIDEIKSQSNLAKEIEILDRYENNVTFRIVYQSDKGNLTKEKVAKIREKITETLIQKFKARVV